MFQTKVVEKIKTHFCVRKLFENRASDEKMWKNIVERGRPQTTIWRTCVACWVPRATTNTHTQVV